MEWVGKVDFGKIGDRDRVTLGVVMRYKEAKDNSPKIEEVG